MRRRRGHRGRTGRRLVLGGEHLGLVARRTTTMTLVGTVHAVVRVVGSPELCLGDRRQRDVPLLRGGGGRARMLVGGGHGR